LPNPAKKPSPAQQKKVACSGFNDMLHDEMQRTFEHAEKYGWGV